MRAKKNYERAVYRKNEDMFQARVCDFDYCPDYPRKIKGHNPLIVRWGIMNILSAFIIDRYN